MTSQDYRKLSVLLAQIKGGERNAFASVYKMYEKKVYFLFCKILSSKSEAADMTAELFAHIYLQIANFPDAMEFEKWMYTALFARARRYMLEKRPEAFGDYTDTDSPEGNEADELLSQDADEMMSYPDGIDISADMLRITDNVLTELPHKLRTTVLGYYLCGFDIEEISAIEQISAMAVKNRLLRARIKMKTQEHKFAELGYDCSGLVVFLPDILATMSQTIVIKQNIAELVTSRTGIVCEGQTTAAPVVPSPELPKSPQYAPSQYAVVPEKKRNFGDDVSPTVKVLTALVALLIIIGGTVAVVLAVQNSKKTPEQGTVGNMENVADEPITIDITLKETTTQEEVTSEPESLTADETTTEETTTQEETTAAEETTTAEEATTEASTTQAEENENENPEEEGNYAVG